MDAIVASLGHPSEVAALLRFKFSGSGKVMYKAKRSLPPKDDSAAYTRAMCYYYLNRTSRSFARVIQELDDELRDPVCIFYLVLRGLDTIEDDMTLPVDKKLPLLRSFHELTTKSGWTFDENGPDEADRELLVNYDVVIDQLLRLKPGYRKTIVDIARRMGAGMADFVAGKQVITLEDFDLYTHYVAGLVGIGLTGLFIESGLENKALADSMPIANDMGLFLQKVNILKDFLGDVRDGRLYWPKAIWKLYVSEGEGVDALAKPENLPNAVACLNHLCANALTLVPKCLDYLSLLRNKSVLGFAAIPQLMAIATIDLFYNNPMLFRKSGNKIRRGLAVKMIERATDFESIKQVYFDYAMSISHKSRKALGTNPADKSFGDIAEACANIVRWIQIHDKKQGLPIRKASSTISTQIVLFFVVLAVAVIVAASQ
ncbi:bifunctional farnesyl-diphosphate farnesyltransferase/squalene synthase [Polyrhizophydium stewartii]|uniref:Bifunctional farnesyl-diphosphate farnesyltransferase/squalene synthase n=1 Tax=Polyrhizophydium stewartii TaxID=2732419 RepID=A0ABR4MZU4_9FUNG